MREEGSDERRMAWPAECKVDRMRRLWEAEQGAANPYRSARAAGGGVRSVVWSDVDSMKAVADALEVRQPLDSHRTCIRTTSTKGMGVFAAEPIEAGATACYYVGVGIPTGMGNARPALSASRTHTLRAYDHGAKDKATRERCLVNYLVDGVAAHHFFKAEEGKASPDEHRRLVSYLGGAIVNSSRPSSRHGSAGASVAPEPNVYLARHRYQKFALVEGGGREWVAMPMVALATISPGAELLWDYPWSDEPVPELLPVAPSSGSGAPLVKKKRRIAPIRVSSTPASSSDPFLAVL